MKRFFLLTTMFTLLSVFSIHAQRVTGVLSGFKAGINVSSLNSDATEIDEIDARVGFQAAFFVEIPFSRSFSFQPELQYSAQGGKQEEFRVNYIHLPLLLKYNVTDYLNIHLGPQVGLKIWEWEQDQNDNFNNLNYAVSGGLGANLSDNFFIEARYVYGLSNITEDVNEFNVDQDIKNSYVQVSLGYRL
ncbi:PorT family protein [Croceibacter atlanticus]|uniref:porin family protein n=1 Tax=Croceibacter atlanticus TaxID=313588 RepID=UPI001C5E9B04|nr:porin family protein [Croceibacter atlanticus]MBW4970756.1 PorT family protein [Croceibacter atlanticus]